MTWEAPEFEYRARDVSWYWLTMIVATALIAFAVWQRDFLFGFFIIVAEVLAIVWANRVPHHIKFVLSDRALWIGSRKQHALSGFQNWSANPPADSLPGESQADDYAELYFNFKGKLRTPLLVRIPAARLEELRKNLQPILPEIEHQPAFIDSLEKLIGF